MQQFSELPWVADYRDPLQCRYDNKVLKYSSIAKWIERKTIQNCSAAVFTTDRAAQLYQRLYPDEKLTKFSVIENGFDEGNFKDVAIVNKELGSKYTLLHSGAVYENGRDPRALFSAVSELKQEGILNDDNFELVFRGASSERYKLQLQRLKVINLVHFKASVSYKESLTEMAATSGLLLIQGRLFNNQTPGKAYEYIRCNKVILALTPNDGSTGRLLQQVNDTEIVESINDIKSAIKKMLLQRVITGRESASFSRYAKTQQLDILLRSLC